MDLNAAGLLQTGAEAQKLDVVHEWRSSGDFSPPERAALAFAEAVTSADLDVDDEVFASVRAHFDEPELVELAAWICLEGFYSSWNRAFRIEPQGFCRVPWARAVTPSTATIEADAG
jgi:alkylhydroperoxidase family enzyme